MYRQITARIFTSNGSRNQRQTVCLNIFRGKTTAYAVSADSGATDSQKDATRQQETVDEDLLDLNDHRKAFASRKTSEIARALFVFKLCSYPLFVKHSLKMMEVGKAALPNRIFTKLMASTVSGQFVGGETPEQLLKTVANLQQSGIGPLLFVPVEEDVGSTEYRSEPYDENLKVLLQCVTLAKQIDQPRPMSQMKLTALVPANICASLSKLVLKADEEHAYLDNITRVLDGGDLELEGLTPAEQDILHQSLLRVKAIGEHVESLNVHLLVDAEYTYLNPALRLISVAMMLRYNRQRPLVAYTYQNYLKQTYDRLRFDEAFVRQRGACFGAKLVRGAYLVKEREMSRVQGYPCPVHASYEDTTEMFHKSIGYAIERSRLAPSRCFTMIGTHNENTVHFIANRLVQSGLRGKDDAVFFGQTYGMCDYITWTLGQSGYLVYKSIPHGPMEQCLVYLARRALENSDALGAVQKDRAMLWKAFRDRCFGGYK